MYSDFLPERILYQVRILIEFRLWNWEPIILFREHTLLIHRAFEICIGVILIIIELCAEEVHAGEITIQNIFTDLPAPDVGVTNTFAIQLDTFLSSNRFT